MKDDADTAEEQLIDAARSGDREAQNRLLERYLPRLQAFVRLRSSAKLRELESSEDIVQSVCRKALENLPKFEYRGTDSFRNWLLRYAENKIRDKADYHGAARRDRGKERDVEGLSQLYATLGTPSRLVGAREQIARFEAAFDRLPDEYREIVLLAKIEGLSHAEIAARTGRSEPASRKMLSRALVRLASLLPDE